MTRRAAPAWIALISLALSAWSPAFADEVAPAVRKPPAPSSILFIGNSFTYYNNSLHMHVRELARSIFEQRGNKKKAKSLYARALTISGSHLADHVLGAKGMIGEFRTGQKDGPWDVVVLQGFSRGPIEEESAASFRHSARQLDTWIRAAGSKTVLFMTWAYRDRPEMAAPLANAYTNLGNEIGALVAPVGLAFELARNENPKMNLHDPDLKHPSRLGTYLAANVFFATLYRENPVGAGYIAGLSDAQAAFAQQIAWRAVQAYFGDEPDA